jgi:hypothetical protein
MNSSAAARGLRLAGWGLPILAVLCCAPSVARASCGDYVVTRTAQADQAMADGHRPAAGAPAPADPRKRCHGPHCSRGPAVPLAPAPTVAPPAPQEWGWLARGPDFAAPGRGALPFDSSCQHPVRLASSIFHPPRHAA